jgi:hypothetical protein
VDTFLLKGGNGRMPAFKALSNEEVAAIVS